MSEFEGTPFVPHRYGDCDCECHVRPGVSHAAPCCYPLMHGDTEIVTDPNVPYDRPVLVMVGPDVPTYTVPPEEEGDWLPPDTTLLGPCGVCGAMARWIEAPTGGWWAHAEHPADDHDAVVEPPMMVIDHDRVAKLTVVNNPEASEAVAYAQLIFAKHAPERMVAVNVIVDDDGKVLASWEPASESFPRVAREAQHPDRTDLAMMLDEIDRWRAIAPKITMHLDKLDMDSPMDNALLDRLREQWKEACG